MYDEVLRVAVTEQIAKQDDFSRSSMKDYDQDFVECIQSPSSPFASMYSDYGALLLGDETVIEDRVDLDTHDARQINSYSSEKNLEYYIQNGINIEINPRKITQGSVESLMRIRAFTVNGFSSVRLNFLFHDLLDHMFTFKAIKESAVVDRHQEYFNSIIGSEGFLFSRQSELLSGIGYNSRRFLTTQEPLDIVNVDHATDFYDGRVEADDVEMMNYVYPSALASLLEQRRRWGVHKIIAEDRSIDGGVDLLGDDYFEFFYDAAKLLTNGIPKRVIAMEQAANLVVADKVSEAIGSGAMSFSVSLSEVETVADSLDGDLKPASGLDISTNFYTG